MKILFFLDFTRNGVPEPRTTAYFETLDCTKHPVGSGIAPCVHVRIGDGKGVRPTLALTSPSYSLFKIKEGETVQVWKNGRPIAIPTGRKTILKRLNSGDDVRIKLVRNDEVIEKLYHVHAIALH